MNRLNEIRRQRRMSLWALAWKVGVRPSALAAVERHDLTLPDGLKTRIAVALGAEEVDIWPGARHGEERL